MKVVRSFCALVLILTTALGTYLRADAGDDGSPLISPTPTIPPDGAPISQADWDAAMNGEFISSANWAYLPSVGLNEWGSPVDTTMINHLNTAGIKLIRYELR